MLKGGIYITAAVFLFIGFLYMFVIDIDTFDFITNNQIKKAEKIHHINDYLITNVKGVALELSDDDDWNELMTPIEWIYVYRL